MQYAPINKVILENFMSITYAEIPWKTIISLCGYNDQGKSAVRTALEVVLYDAYSTEQVRYIKDGTEYFKITLYFTDGVRISKEKQNTGTSIWRMEKQEGTTLKLIYTNAQSDGACIAVEDVPDVIAKYLGVYYDEVTQQELNVRKDRDNYFLVDSSGGDNYKLLNPLLHSETLAQASELLLKDSNTCKKQMDEVRIKVTTYEGMLEDKEDVSLTAIELLDRYIVEAGANAKRNELLQQVCSEHEKMRTVCVPPEITLCSVQRLNALLELERLNKQVTTPIHESIKSCDIARLQLLNQLKVLQEQATVVAVYKPLVLIDINQYQFLQQIYEQYQKVAAYDAQIEVIESDYKKAVQQKTELKQQIAQMGYKVCKNCGSIVE